MFLQKVNLEDYMLPCINKKMFGIDCPGCGIQRSFVHVVKGEFQDAFHLYPAIFTLILLILFFILNKRFKFKFGKKIIGTLAVINIAVIIVSYIIKMNKFLQLT